MTARRFAWHGLGVLGAMFTLNGAVMIGLIYMAAASYALRVCRKMGL